MENNILSILGAGGHAKVVLEAATYNFCKKRIFLYDANPQLIGTKLLKEWIVKDQNYLRKESALHVAIGNNEYRKQLSCIFVSSLEKLVTIIHPTAVISLTSYISPGCFIAAGSIIGPQAQMGYGAIINHMAVVDHDCIIGEWCHVAPHATLGGNVKIGHGVLVGAGSVILPGIEIGDNVVIGAGAVVTRNISAHKTVIGIPARIYKK